jgi:diacylglycerol kinase (ATP)
MHSPEQFDSQLRNKIWYAFFGWKAMMGQDYHGISSRVSLKIDGKEVCVPPQSQGVILVNIDSFAGGSRLWHADGEYHEQAHNDQLVEVVSVDGPLHLGQIKTGISEGQKLGQCKRVELRFLQMTHIQFDGEPEMLPPCRATVVHAGQALMLCNSDRLSHHRMPDAARKHTAIDFDQVVASVLKDAQQSGIIDARQARNLKKSFSAHAKRHEHQQ